MSKLRRAIQSFDTRNRQAKPLSLTCLTVDNQLDISNDLFYSIYRVEARFRIEFKVNESINGSALEYCIKEAENRIVDEVFGEFNSLIQGIREAIHNKDFNIATNLIDQLYKEMYE